MGGEEFAVLQAKAGNRAVNSLVNGTKSLRSAKDDVNAGVEPAPANKRGFVVPEIAPPPRRGGRRLPAQLRAEMERSFGAGFDNVKVHLDEELADELQATAFTIGNDLHFGPGSYQPHSGRGRQVIAHELTHVVQQRAGRVRSPGDDGLPVNTEHSLESEADRLGRHAAWLLPVRVKGAKSRVRKPVDVTAQKTDGAQPSAGSSPAE